MFLSQKRADAACARSLRLNGARLSASSALALALTLALASISGARVSAQDDSSPRWERKVVAAGNPGREAPVIALLDFESSTLGTNETDAFSQALWSEFFRSPHTRVLPRRATRQYLIRYDLYPGRRYGPSAKVEEAAEALRAGYLLRGHINVVGGTYSFDFQLYSAAAGGTLIKDNAVRNGSIKDLMMMAGVIGEAVVMAVEREQRAIVLRQLNEQDERDTETAPSEVNAEESERARAARLAREKIRERDLIAREGDHAGVEVPPAEPAMSDASTGSSEAITLEPAQGDFAEPEPEHEHETTIAATPTPLPIDPSHETLSAAEEPTSAPAESISEGHEDHEELESRETSPHEAHESEAAHEETEAETTEMTEAEVHAVEAMPDSAPAQAAETAHAEPEGIAEEPAAEPAETEAREEIAADPEPVANIEVSATAKAAAREAFEEHRLLPDDRNDEKIALLKKSTALDPTEGTYRKALALAYYRGGNFEAAVEECKAAMPLMPDDSMLRTVMGSAYFEAREFDGAREAHEEAIALDPGNLYSRFNLALTLQAQESPKALGAWEDYLERSEGIPEQAGIRIRAQKLYDDLKSRS